MDKFEKPENNDILGNVIFALAMLALALAPTQITFAVKRISLTPAEFLLVIAALVWGIRWFKARDTRNLPPMTSWLLVAAGGLSIIGLLTDATFLNAASDIRGDLVKGFALDFAKLVLYFLVLYTVFRAVLTSPQRVKTAVICLLIGVSAAVALATFQRGLLGYQNQPDPQKRHTLILTSMKKGILEDTGAEELPSTTIVLSSPYSARVFTTIETPIEVSSTFGSWDKHGFHASRTAYAGFLALALPFALAFLVSSGKKQLAVILWMSLLFLGAAVSVLAGYIVPALLLGLLVTGIMLGPKARLGVLLGIVGYLALLVVSGGINLSEVLQEPYRLTISQEEAKFRYGDSESGDNGVAHLKKFWGEQQAALNLMRSDIEYAHRNPLFGIGVGQYQATISQGYESMGQVMDQRLESDAQNGYLLAGLTMGMLGLAALLALFGSGLRQACRLARQGAGKPWMAAAAGSMASLLLMTLFMNPIVRGDAVLIVALLAMITNFASQEAFMQGNGE